MMVVTTMLGLGDAFAARPTIATLALRNKDVAVVTPWPEVFSDIPNLTFLKRMNLHIQCAKRNSAESKLFYNGPIVWGKEEIHLSYSLQAGCKSIPEQIAESAGVRPNWADFFRGPSLATARSCHSSPLGVFRVPTIRTEYHNVARNPAPSLVYDVVKGIGGDWIHLNDLSDGEQMSPCEKHSDRVAKAMQGELSLPSMLDLVSRARVVVTPVSWMAWAALAYQVPTFCLFGGFASPETIFGPLLKRGDNFKVITPNIPCWCFDRFHKCDKTTDLEGKLDILVAANGLQK